MLKYNGSILKLPSKAIVDYVAPPVQSYMRYMWKFTGATTKDNYREFQMACLKINDISFPYTYIASGLTYGSAWSDGVASNLIDVDETNKWGGGLSYGSGTQSGWIIFDLPSAIVPLSYSLKTANDTAEIGRNPTYAYLYASLETPTTDTDPSWVLLDERDPELPRSNLTWCGPYILNQV